VAALEDSPSILRFAKKHALPQPVYGESADQFGVEKLSSLRLLLAYTPSLGAAAASNSTLTRCQPLEVHATHTFGQQGTEAQLRGFVLSNLDDQKWS
jgi:hypothetical protein